MGVPPESVLLKRWPKARWHVFEPVNDDTRLEGARRAFRRPLAGEQWRAMLAQPQRSDPGWDATCRRLLATYLAGLGSGTSGNPAPGA